VRSSIHVTEVLGLVHDDRVEPFGDVVPVREQVTDLDRVPPFAMAHASRVLPVPAGPVTQTRRFASNPSRAWTRWWQIASSFSRASRARLGLVAELAVRSQQIDQLLEAELSEGMLPEPTRHQPLHRVEAVLEVGVGQHLRRIGTRRQPAAYLRDVRERDRVLDLEARQRRMQRTNPVPQRVRIALGLGLGQRLRLHRIRPRVPEPLYAALISAGLDLPTLIDGLFGEEAAGWTFGISGTAAVVGSTVLRRGALALAATVRLLIDYTRNSERIRDTVCLTVDDAIAGLRDNGWHGKIHLLGYSFGSLLLHDAALPHPNAQKRTEPFDATASLVTVGCPLDVVRLYYPKYTEGREARNATLKWKNIYNAADVLGSNLSNKMTSTLD
jgi:hypothetical protein